MYMDKLFAARLYQVNVHVYLHFSNGQIKVTELELYTCSISSCTMLVHYVD